MLAVLIALALAQSAQGFGTATAPDPVVRAALPPLLSEVDGVTRRFTSLPDGGTFEVGTGDPARVARVRDRLREDAARFARGAFGHPQLSAGARNIDVAYADTADGGRVRFITADPALVYALHAWLAEAVRRPRR